MTDKQSEQRETEAAAADAAAIGGLPGSDAQNLPDEAQRPLDEAGEGEAEGFEQAEELLREHATHGDQRDAGHVIDEAAEADEDRRAAPGAEGDAEFSSEDASSDR
jgi:hypothetical protein